MQSAGGLGVGREKAEGRSALPAMRPVGCRLIVVWFWIGSHAECDRLLG